MNMTTQIGSVDDEFVDAVDRYAREKLAPNISAWDAARSLPPEVMAEMGEMGLFGLLADEEVGGLGLGFPTFCRIIETLAKHAGGVSTIVHVHNLGPGMLLPRLGIREHRNLERKLAKGELLSNMCLTEPQAGSDTSMLRARALKTDGGWVLNGNKQFISNGRIAGITTVIAVTDPEAGKRGMSLFLVPTDTPGFKVTGTEEKLGQHVSDTASISIEDCFVPESALLGEPGSAYGQIMSALSDGRVAIAAQALGFAQGAFELARQYATERTAYGKPIINHQALAFRLADMFAEIDIARTYVYRVAQMVENDQPCIAQASSAKLFASQMGERVCSEALQIFGGYGYVEETGVARYYRDVRVCQIYEGTNDIQRLVIARSLGHSDK